MSVIVEGGVFLKFTGKLCIEREVHVRLICLWEDVKPFHILVLLQPIEHGNVNIGVSCLIKKVLLIALLDNEFGKDKIMDNKEC